MVIWDSKSNFVDANTGWATIFIGASGTLNLLKKHKMGGNNWTTVNQSANKFLYSTLLMQSKGWLIRMTFINGNVSPPFEILEYSNGGVNWTVSIFR